MSYFFSSAFEATSAIRHDTAPLSGTNFTAKICLGTQTEFAFVALRDVTIKGREKNSLIKCIKKFLGSCLSAVSLCPKPTVARHDLPPQHW